ncbi:hypothetical protein HT102_00320 [Hoyosella sp. G463]|uniref:Uncharacterized protein n=1 Tax=Lolliginicoccus lacisalsi TaxID=2742202 RepID=A0A927J9E1_9ACTN|nr:hypothetical protein [Lolliginicoccus lacisalsi]MBD8504931.1 hypothetical protein [Lolliginicoccus lacisalsi]
MATTRHDLHGHALADELLEEHPEYALPHSLEIDESVPPRPEEEIADSR